jgi:hypothetical protein
LTSPSLSEFDPTTQALLDVLRERAAENGDEFTPGSIKVVVRCFQPEKHQNGDADPSATYTFGKYIVCPVCGYKKGEKAFASALGIGELQGGLTLSALAEAKEIPPEFLRGHGWSTRRSKGQAAVFIPWFDARGPVKSAPGYHLRHHLNKEDGAGPRFTWDMGKGAKLLPFGSHEIAEWRGRCQRDRIPLRVWLMESELDAVTGWLHDVPAIAYGGTQFWNKNWVNLFTAAATVFVVAEGDTPGQEAARRIALDLHLALAEVGVDVQVVPFTEDFKDFNSLHRLVGGDKSKMHDELRRLIARSIPASKISEEDSFAQAEAQQQERNRLAALAGPLLQDPAILHKAIMAVEANGVVGERRAVGLLFLALKSRVAKRPVNVEVMSPSSTGKTHTVLGVLNLEDPTAFYELTAGSERSLIYLDEPLKHRTLYIQEPEGLAEGVGAAAIKSLVWEGRLRYDTVVKEEGEFVGRHIEKDGPTGLILTTTKPVDAQITNRMLQIDLDATPGQTGRILVAIAQSMNGAKPVVDFAPWHAASVLLGEPIDVELCFGEWLASHLVTKHSLRLRRDFTHLLTLIQSSAILHQYQRARGPDGRLQATLADYAHVRELAGPIFQAVQSDNVTDADRRMVEAVDQLSTPESEDGEPRGVSQASLSRALEVSKQAVSGRVTKLLKEGYLLNLNAGVKGGRHKLVPGDPLPANIPPLPDPGELAQYLLESGRGNLISPWVNPLNGDFCENTPFLGLTGVDGLTVVSEPRLGAGVDGGLTGVDGGPKSGNRQPGSMGGQPPGARYELDTRVKGSTPVNPQKGAKSDFQNICLVCGEPVPSGPAKVYLRSGVRHDKCPQAQAGLPGVPPPDPMRGH